MNAKTKTQGRVRRFFSFLRSEIKQLHKPSFRTWCKLTGGVLLGAAVSACAIGGVDAVFTQLLRLLVG